MEPGGSKPHSQGVSNKPYPEPHHISQIPNSLRSFNDNNNSNNNKLH